MTVRADIARAAGARTRFYMRVEGLKESLWEDVAVPDPSGAMVGEGAPGAHPVQGDTVALWRFDEWAITADPQDSGPNALHLTQHGSPPVYDGKFSRSRYFNSNTKYCDRDTDPRLQLQRFTIAAWVYVDSLTQDSGAKVIYLERTATTDDFSFTLETQGANARLGAKLYMADTSTVSAFDTADAAIGWHHLVVTWDGDTLRVYLDAELAASDGSGAGESILYTTSGVKLSVGNLNGGGTKRWNGRIDDVAIYSTAKSAEWIRRTYVHGDGHSRPGLVCLGLDGEYSDELDLGKMQAQPGAFGVTLQNIADPADPSTYWFAKLFAPGRWSASSTLSTWVRRANTTDYYLSAQANEIIVQHLSGWPSHGEAYIGCESFSYTATTTETLSSGETGAKFTGVQKGLYPCYEQDDDYYNSQRTYRHARHDVTSGDAGAMQVVSNVPLSWIGRRVGIYLTAWDEDNQQWYDHGDSLLYWAGTIGDTISYDPTLNVWRIGLDHIVKALDRKVMTDSPAGALVDVINLEGTSGRGLKVMAYPEGILKHSTTISIDSGRYTPQSLVAEVNAKLGAATWKTDYGAVSHFSGMPIDLEYLPGGKVVMRGSFALYLGDDVFGDIRVGYDPATDDTSLVLAALGFDASGTMVEVNTASVSGATYPLTTGKREAENAPMIGMHPLHKDCNGGNIYVAYDEGWWSSQGDYGDTRAFLVSDKCKVHSGFVEGHGDADKRVAVATTGNTGNQFALHAVQPMPEYWRSFRGAYIGYTADEKPIEFREAYMQETYSYTLARVRGPLELLLYPLLSTGTSGVGHSFFDKLPLELCIGIPAALIDIDSFLAMDRQLQARANGFERRDYYLIDKPTSWLDLFQRDAQAFGFFLAWKRGKLRVQSAYNFAADQQIVQLDDTNCVAWPSTEITLATVVNQWEFKIDYDYATDKYRAPIQVADIASQQALGMSKGVKIEHPGIRAGGETEQIVDKLRALIEPAISLLRSPWQRVTVELSPTLLDRIYVGDIVAYVANARHPDPFGTGAMTCSATALVLSLSWAFGEARKGVASLLLFAGYDIASRRPWAGSALVDRTATNAGWDSTNKRLTLIALEFGEAGDSDDGARFASGDYVLIIDRNPVDPASLTSSEIWGPIAVASAYETDGAQLLTLAGGTTLTGWDTTHEYVVVPADYADAVAGQRLVNAYQAAVSDAKLNSADAAHRWG